MSGYGDQRAAQLDEVRARTTTTLSAVALQTDPDNWLSGRGMLPHNPCACVTEPCECDGYDHGETVLWIEASSIRRSTDSGRSSTHGDAILEIELDSTALVVLETV